MIQIIGLIIALYAFVRFLQAPIIMTADREQFLKLPFHVRFYIVAGISVLGLMVLAILTLLLLTSHRDLVR